MLLVTLVMNIRQLVVDCRCCFLLLVTVTPFIHPLIVSPSVRSDSYKAALCYGLIPFPAVTSFDAACHQGRRGSVTT